MNKRLARIIVSALLMLAAALLGDRGGAAGLLLYIAAYLLVGYGVLWEALRGLLRGGFISENFLMSVATLGAFAIGESIEGVLVMLLFQIGELFQSLAVGKSRRSIAALMEIRPDQATVSRDGRLLTIPAEEAQVGETIVIRPGERVPLDAILIEGESSLDTSALTGESIPRRVTEGDALLSGCVNLLGLLHARVTRPFSESTATKILELVENAAANKSRSERFITRFSRIYTPVVVGLAALLATAGPLITGESFALYLHRALSFLVVSCPCALVISVPLSFFGGIGSASRKGILVKGGADLEALASAEIVVMDKTGTLTQGAFDVTAMHGQGAYAETLLELAAHAESGSTHPISQSLKRAYAGEVDPARVKGMEEVRGHGVRAVVDGQSVAAGNARLMEQLNIPFEADDCVGTIVHTAINGAYAGHIVIADQIKPDAKAAVAALREAGVSRIIMLTGDRAEVGEETARSLGLDGVKAELLPADKVSEVEKLLSQKSKRGMLVYVGDGINDAPVLARADVGVAMGGLGSDAAIEAADVVLMTDEPSKLATAIRIARRTLAISNENIAFSLGIKAAVLLASAFGATSILLAIFADVGVTLLAILNAMRALAPGRRAGSALTGAP